MPSVTVRDVQIRPGKLQDLEQVREFTRHTFSWGDYLPDVWNRWVNSKHGKLLVAEADGMVVGTTRVTFLGNAEAWLEAVRVRHSHRQRGVATQLIRESHLQAVKHNCHVIRLETFADNFAAQRVFKRFGYRHITGYAGFRGKARAGALDKIRRATGNDLETCWELWQHSWVKRSCRAIAPSDYGWRWWELTRERLANQIRDNKVWLVPGGFMVLRDEGDDYDITLLIGQKPVRKRLLEAAQAIAASENKKMIYWLTPRSGTATRQAGESGLVLDEEGLEIYALEL